ncbi:MAG: hypothetical protein QOG15_914 [Solirubrobacteraceae bacterium]|jgi:competence protein ComGC|nr:hypothetical protein [Solirubrobacteraceae bacterium]
MGDALTLIATSSNQKAWVFTLIAAFVVLLVVILLLEMLRRAVVSLNKSLWTTWVSGKAVVKHTATTYMLKNTRISGEELVDELSNH